MAGIISNKKVEQMCCVGGVAICPKNVVYVNIIGAATFTGSEKKKYVQICMQTYVLTLRTCTKYGRFWHLHAHTLLPSYYYSRGGGRKNCWLMQAE